MMSGKDNSLERLEILLKTASPLALFAGLGYLTGWLYRTTYLATFGIPRISEPLQEYFLSSWIIVALDTLVTLALIGLAWRASPIYQPLSPLLSVWLTTAGLAVALVALVLMMLEPDVLLSYKWFALLCLGVSLSAFSSAQRHVTPNPLMDRLRNMLLGVAGSFLLLSLLVCSAIFGAKDALAHMQLEPSQFAIPSWPPPAVTLVSESRLNIGAATVQPDSACPCEYTDLHLVLAAKDFLYFYKPPTTYSVKRRVFMVPSRLVISVHFEPSSEAHPTATPTPTPTPELTSTPTPTLTPMPEETPTPVAELTPIGAITADRRHNMLDRIANNTALGTEGGRVRVVGIIGVYRSNLEIAPTLPNDVVMLEMP